MDLAHLRGALSAVFNIGILGTEGPARKGAGRELRAALAGACAIVCACPVCMGSVPVRHEAFLEEAAAPWLDRERAGGMAVATYASGDKLVTLIRLSVHAAQIGMIRVGSGDVGAPVRPEPPRDRRGRKLAWPCRLTRQGGRGIYLGMIILKILRKAEWEALRAGGLSDGAPVDVADGYIHFSTVFQAPETAARHFAGAFDLMLVACESEAMGDELRWEPSRGGQEFPHLYRALRLSDVVWAQPLPLVGGVHQFPPGLA